MKLTRQLLFIAASIAIAAPAAALPATASTGPEQRTVTVEMHVVGFNERVAERNGYDIRTRPDGTQYSVDTKTGEIETVEPTDTAAGECGTSNITINGFNNPDHYTLTTGFSIYSSYPRAVDFSWSAPVTGAAGDYSWTWEWGRAINSRTWGAFKEDYNTPPGIYQALVPSSSFAILSDGTVCNSASPSSETVVG